MPGILVGIKVRPYPPGPGGGGGGSVGTFSLDFINQVYSYDGNSYPALASVPGWSYSRANAATAVNVAGLVVVFAANAPRLTNKGLLLEAGRSNGLKWNRDLTNVAWTASGLTAALDQVGADGVANAASSLTCTTGGGTIMQSYTAGSTTHLQSACMKRISGSGAVNMTQDGGATWTAVSPALTTSWQQVSVPAAALANPNCGIQLMTAGDVIAVDFVSNENGQFLQAPIPTTTTGISRPQDTAQVANANLAANATLYAEYLVPTPATATPCAVGVSSTVRPLTHTGSVSPYTPSTYNTAQLASSGVAVPGGNVAKVAVSMTAAPRVAISCNGGVAVGANSAGGWASPFLLGYYASGAGLLNSYLRKVQLYNTALSDAQLQSLTT